MTIFYSKRILPTNEDDTENNYMRIPGTIQNNTLDIEGNYTAPSLNSPIPSTAPENLNHEIRLQIENATKPSVVDSSVTQSIYFLPSAAFGFHNIITNKLTILDPDLTTITLLQGDDSNIPTKSSYESTVYDSNVAYTISLENDGVLSSVYNFCFNNTYMDELGYNHYGFIISSYINETLTDQQMFPNLSSAGITLNNISSTREFEIGHDDNLFTNVALLLHGKLKQYSSSGVSEPSIPSTYFEGIPNVYTDLYWVGVTFFFTNYENKICTTANASSINVRTTIGSPFENAFKPYFAKKTKIIESKPIQYKAVERTQFGITRGCPISTNTPLNHTDIYGNKYIGDGTLSTTVSNTDRDLITISESVSLTDVIDESIHVYLILLPC
jgi:hypothetical protein